MGNEIFADSVALSRKVKLWKKQMFLMHFIKM